MSFVGCPKSEIKSATVDFVQSHLLRIPRHCANSFPAHVVQGQALLPRLDIPDSDKASTATRDQDVCDLLIPVQAFNIVSAGSGASESVRVRDIVEIRDVELQ